MSKEPFYGLLLLILFFIVIGLHILLMPTATEAWYLTFEPMFVVLSLLVPMLVTALAFLLLGVKMKGRTLHKLTFCGLISGLSCESIVWFVVHHRDAYEGYYDQMDSCTLVLIHPFFLDFNLTTYRLLLVLHFNLTSPHPR